jgi:hypothetical protein
MIDYRLAIHPGRKLKLRAVVTGSSSSNVVKLLAGRAVRISGAAFGRKGLNFRS